jgi:hypothetical protein
LLISFDNIIFLRIHKLIGKVEPFLILVVRNDVELYLMIFNDMLIHKLSSLNVQFILPFFNWMHGSGGKKDGIRLAALDLFESKPRNQAIQRNSIVYNVAMVIAFKHCVSEFDTEN